MMRIDRRSLLLSVAALAACGQSAAPPPEAPAASDPAAVIRPLYDRYTTPPAQYPGLLDEPWSDALKALLADMAARSEAANEPILDFDPFINAQDGTITDLQITTDAVAENSHAVVRAAFKNGDRSETVLYDLVWESGAWKIDNVRGPEWDLRQIAASGPRP